MQRSSWCGLSAAMLLLAAALACASGANADQLVGKAQRSSSLGRGPFRLSKGSAASQSTLAKLMDEARDHISRRMLATTTVTKCLYANNACYFNPLYIASASFPQPSTAGEKLFARSTAIALDCTTYTTAVDCGKQDQCVWGATGCGALPLDALVALALTDSFYCPGSLAREVSTCSEASEKAECLSTIDGVNCAWKDLGSLTGDSTFTGDEACIPASMTQQQAKDYIAAALDPSKTQKSWYGSCKTADVAYEYDTACSHATEAACDADSKCNWVDPYAYDDEDGVDSDSGGDDSDGSGDDGGGDDSDGGDNEEDGGAFGGASCEPDADAALDILLSDGPFTTAIIAGDVQCSAYADSQACVGVTPAAAKAAEAGGAAAVGNGGSAGSASVDTDQAAKYKDATSLKDVGGGAGTVRSSASVLLSAALGAMMLLGVVASFA